MSANASDTEPSPVEVASGDRHEEIHFEPDANQLVVARHLVRPTEPLALDMTSERDDDVAATEKDVPPVEDVRVGRDAPSVWDARPAPDETSG